jgi:Reverse transcriptase (RNA-dependent DNA polymerase).
VFIPKPDRNSYSGPTGFRDMSLTSLLLKTVERPVDTYLRGEALALVPFHPNQRAEQAGKSVEAAPHQLVIRAEKALDQQETPLCVLFDIEGALNNTSCDSTCDALVRHWVDHTTVQWIRAILEGGMAAATLSGSSMRTAVSRG